MKKMLNRIVAIIILVELVGINLLADAVYANNLITENIKANKEVIEFNANINNSNNTTVNLEEENNLNINLSLKEDGFLKDVKVTIEGNNYEIAKDADEINKNLMGEQEITSVNKIIQSINGNEIALKEVDEGEKLNIQIPIKFVKNDLVTKENLESDSTITMVATYINGQNKETQETKTINQHLKWNIKAEEEISQKLVRYLKYDNRTMVSFEVTDLIKDNKLPIDSKEISIVIPTINNQQPEIITVVGEGIEKELNNGTLKVSKKYQPTETGEYDWNSESKFTVTYLYNTQSDATLITSPVTSKVTSILGDVIEGKSLNNDFEINAEVGSIVQFDTKTPEELSKGYIYTNLNREDNKIDTTFNVNHTINIGLADLTDKIVLEEKNYSFSNEDNSQSADVTKYITTKKVGIVQEELIKVLGEEGKIIVKDSNLNEVATLDKNNTEIDVDSNTLTFEISDPVKEGLINIYEIKALNGQNDFSVEDLLSIKSLSVNSNIIGFDKGTTVTNAEKKVNINLTEPTSNASLEINTENLSTVTANNEIVLNVVLNTTDISDALYIDPTVKINFPEEITSITPKSAKIIYDDQLVIDHIESEDRSIIFNLKGVQNKYNTLNTTKGTILQVIVDVEVNKLVPSNKTKITVDYTNQFTTETNTLEKEINIVAPYGMITTNEINIDDNNLFTINDEVEPIKIKGNDIEKIMKITGRFINNTGEKAKNVSIVGRIPASGNKNMAGEDLQSNFDTILDQPIEVIGINNYKVLYSNNVEEGVNGDGWQEQATSDSKSYKIVLLDDAEDKTVGEFHYTVKIPESVGNQKTAKENFGIYYTIYSKEESKQYTEESKVLGIQTGLEPSISLGISAIDTNEGYSIDNGGEVKEGQYISYRVKVVNTGSDTANNVTIAAKLPDGLTLIIPEQSMQGNTMVNYRESESKLLVQNAGNIAGGDSITYEFTAKVNDMLTENEKVEGRGKSLTIGFGAAAENLGEEAKTTSFSVKNVSGYFGLKLASNVVNTVETNQEIKYELTLSNANKDNKTNTKIIVKLPKNVEFLSIDSKYENEVKYNKKDNSITINAGTLNGGSREIINFNAKNLNEDVATLETEAEGLCDGLNGVIKSNKIEFLTEPSMAVIEVSQVCSSNNIDDTTDLELYTDITNKGFTAKEIEFVNYVSAQLGGIEYKVTKDEVILNSGNDSYIHESILIAPKSTVRVYIKAKPFPVDEGKQIEIYNKPVIILTDGSQINVQEQKITVQGTDNRQSIKSSDNSKEEKNIEEVKVKTFRITGNAWAETNNNGIKNVQDESIEGLKLMLFDANENKAVLNENGEKIVAYTDEHGRYEFDNVKPGNYYVVSPFDNEIYELTLYRADNVDETLNSDFIKSVLNNENIAVTDVININDMNVNHIDLGLFKKEIFDLAIKQTVNKITISSKDGTRTIRYDSELANLELTSNELENSTAVVEYNIKVSNIGNTEGLAKSIMNYIPTGMTFNSQLNPDWYQTKDGILHCVSLADVFISPGDSQDIKLLLTKKIENNDIGLSRGRTEIEKTYNEMGLKEVKALSTKYSIGDSNMSSANIVTSKETKVKLLSVITISLLVIMIMGFLGFEVKKRVFDKMYNKDKIN